MDETVRSNRRAWETASEKHVREYADLLAVAAAGSSLVDLERELLRDVLSASPEVVHWQSGNGTDDVALVRSGARSVGPGIRTSRASAPTAVTSPPAT